MVPVIIPGDDKADRALGRLGVPELSSGAIARDLQTYTVLIPAKARALLIANGKASFHRPDLRGDQFCVLDEMSLYHDDSGLWWEDADYLAGEQWMI